MSNGINIPITATVNATQLGQLQGSLSSLRTSLKQAKADLDAAAPNSKTFQQAAAEVKKLEAEIKTLEGAATKAAGSKGDAGMGMLQLGQALEDAQYGLRGVMNNIPGLVMSLGLGAGAAGVLQVGLVAVSQILDLIGQQSKGMENKPLLGDLSFDEKVMESARQFAEVLERQRDAVQQRNEALRETVEAANAAIQAEQELIKFRRQVEDEDFVSTGDPVIDAAVRRDKALQRTVEDASTRESERGVKLEGARGEQQNREQELATLEAQLAKQNEIIDGVKTRALLEARVQDLYKGISDDKRALEGKVADPLKNPAQFARDIKAILTGDRKLTASEDVETARSLRAKENELQTIAARLGKLPMLPGFETTGKADEDEKKRRELFAAEVERQRELQKLRDDAAREAENGRRRLATTEAATAYAAQLDAEKTAREQEMIRRRAEAETQRALETEAKKRAEEQEKQAAAEELSKGVSSARAGLKNMANRGIDGDPNQDSPATPAPADAPAAFRQGIGSLDAALSDGKGDTQAELAVVKDMQAKIASGQMDRAGALQEALRAMEALQTNGSEMERRLVSTLNTYGQTLRSLSSALSALEGEMETIRANNRR